MLPSPMKALGRKAKENSPDELHISVLTGRTKKIKALLTKGVHIESVNNLGQTPLFCAAYGGDYEIVELLLRLGANPNRRCGSTGASPVHAAAYRGSRRVLRILVETGGDLSLLDAEFLTPRDYALKQPSPIRRQKILEFLDLLCAMTLHRTHCARLSSSASSSATATLQQGSSLPGTLKHAQHNKLFGSQLSLSRKSSLSSVNLLGSCIASDAGSPIHPMPTIPSIPEGKEVPTPNLHKSVSCHLLDQLCVTTSLPLLSPIQLQRPRTPTPAYTCGGPTVYSSFTWIGTPVTVRRPTPALALHRHSDDSEGSDLGSPDGDAVRSLLQELSFLRRLRHPGFLEVMAACHVTHPSPDHVTLVFQNVPHGSLFHHLHEQHRDLSVGCAVDILVNMVEALLFMHAHGWFHCGLTSHAVHLVSLGAAKLGGFEYAMESQAKGCGMRAEQLNRATWLVPWQPAETVVEKMVSVKSEIYSVSAIMWEIWAGMSPWAGIEEEQIAKRIENGETLPLLPPSSLVPSLISYLIEYGLKGNAHERVLDLQEIHTILRSLRIQCNEDERVPVVTSWGPPSIPNTPVIGRQAKNSSSSSIDSRLDPRKFLANTQGGGYKGRECKRLDERKEPARYTPKSSFEMAQESIHKQLSKMMPLEQRSKAYAQKERTNSMQKSFDSGFSTPGSRTPSPTYDEPAPPKNHLTSTPNRHSALMQRLDHQPDILPSRIAPNKLMASKHPDLVSSQLEKAAPPTKEKYLYIKSPAKRAFLQNGESSGFPDTSASPESDGPCSSFNLESGSTRMEVVKRGLSLNNISSSALSACPATVFTRTTSHVSLCSSSSSSSTSSSEGRKAHRTISQITLTMKKLSLSSSSSKDEVSECPAKESEEPSRKPKNEDSHKPLNHSALAKNSLSASRTGWDEITGIKPASHRLTRHSSSCSLASGPPSPANQASSSGYYFLASSRMNKMAASHGSLPTSPQHSTASMSQTLPARSSNLISMSPDAEGAVSKLSPRRHSETLRPKSRRHRKRHEVEVEEEFIDDEFNALLYDQPHMQLSVGSSENLLDSRLTSSLLGVDSESSSLSGGQFSHHVTSSEDDEEDSRPLPARVAKCRPLLKALEETGDSDNAEEDYTKEAKSTTPRSQQPPVGMAASTPLLKEGLLPLKQELLPLKSSPGNPKERQDPTPKGDKPLSPTEQKDGGASSTGSPAEFEDDVFEREANVKKDAKDYEPLNNNYSVMKNLRKDLTSYLPTYSIGSDSDS